MKSKRRWSHPGTAGGSALQVSGNQAAAETRPYSNKGLLEKDLHGQAAEDLEVELDRQEQGASHELLGSIYFQVLLQCSPVNAGRAEMPGLHGETTHAALKEPPGPGPEQPHMKW